MSPSSSFCLAPAMKMKIWSPPLRIKFLHMITLKLHVSFLVHFEMTDVDENCKIDHVSWSFYIFRAYITVQNLVFVHKLQFVFQKFDPFWMEFLN